MSRVSGQPASLKEVLLEKYRTAVECDDFDKAAMVALQFGGVDKLMRSEATVGRAVRWRTAMAQEVRDAVGGPLLDYSGRTTELFLAIREVWSRLEWSPDHLEHLVNFLRLRLPVPGVGYGTGWVHGEKPANWPTGSERSPSPTPCELAREVLEWLARERIDGESGAFYSEQSVEALATRLASIGGES